MERRSPPTSSGALPMLNITDEFTRQPGSPISPDAPASASAPSPATITRRPGGRRRGRSTRYGWRVPADGWRRAAMSPRVAARCGFGTEHAAGLPAPPRRQPAGRSRAVPYRRPAGLTRPAGRFRSFLAIVERRGRSPSLHGGFGIETAPGAFMTWGDIASLPDAPVRCSKNISFSSARLEPDQEQQEPAFRPHPPLRYLNRSRFRLFVSET